MAFTAISGLAGIAISARQIALAYTARNAVIYLGGCIRRSLGCSSDYFWQEFSLWCQGYLDNIPGLLITSLSPTPDVTHGILYSMFPHDDWIFYNPFYIQHDGMTVFYRRPVEFSTKTTQSQDELAPNHLQEIMDWSKKEYSPLNYNKVDGADDFCDPTSASMSVYTTLDMCFRLRHGMKPLFFILAKHIKAIEDALPKIEAEIENKKGTFENTLADYATIDDVNNVLKEYTQLTHLEENYLTKGQIEETYCNFDELHNCFTIRKIPMRNSMSIIQKVQLMPNMH